MIAQGIKFEGSNDGGTTWTDLGCIRDFELAAAARNEIDVTCLSSAAKEFKFGLADYGTLSLNYEYTVGTESIKLIEESYNADVPFDWKITYNDDPAGGTPTTKEFQGYVMEYSESGAVDDVVMGSCSIKLTGAITETPAQPAP